MWFFAPNKLKQKLWRNHCGSSFLFRLFRQHVRWCGQLQWKLKSTNRTKLKADLLRDNTTIQTPGAFLLSLKTHICVLSVLSFRRCFLLGLGHCPCLGSQLTKNDFWERKSTTHVAGGVFKFFSFGWTTFSSSWNISNVNKIWWPSSMFLLNLNPLNNSSALFQHHKSQKSTFESHQKLHKVPSVNCADSSSGAS